MKKIMKKAFGCLAAAGLYLALTAQPAMAQEEILINPNAVQKLQNASADSFGYKHQDIPVSEFFIGIPAEGSILTTVSDCLQKYHPNDWALVGKDDCYFSFSDGAGNTLFFHLFPYEIDNFAQTFNSSIDGLSPEQWRTLIERPLASHRAISPDSMVEVLADAPGGLDALIAGIIQINSVYPNAAALQQPSQPVLPAAQPGGWKQDAAGWWYDNGDGTWMADGWKWIDGNLDGVAECYYFSADGYLVTNTTTPDGFQVNQDGAWIINDTIQRQ